LNPKRKKTCITLNVEPFHWGQQKFIFQNCWSPTWTNSTIVSMGYLLYSTLWYILFCIKMGVHPKFFLFFGQEAGLIGPSPKTSKTMETPQNLMILF
jgi:hypothetical protein